MRGAWKRFVEMPDAERALALAKVAAVVVLVVLYLLGGASLYLRQRYLAAPTQRPLPAATATAPALAPTSGPLTAPVEPTPTLYPTMTPSADN